MNFCVRFNFLIYEDIRVDFFKNKKCDSFYISLLQIFTQEEEEFVKEHPFLEQQQPPEESQNISIFSGISDKSIVLR
jgi:hypothetical protein